MQQGSEDDITAVQKLSSAWRDTVIRGDSDGYLALLSDDVEEIQPGLEPVSGSAVREMVDEFFATFDVEMPPLTGVEILVCGDLAYHRYTYEWTLKPKLGGDSVSERAHGIHILRRQQDGSWKITKDLYANVYSRPLTA
jgi:ketosteroid isomerase-like protein